MPGPDINTCRFFAAVYWMGYYRSSYYRGGLVEHIPLPAAGVAI
jgi:hypothetical protein